MLLVTGSATVVASVVAAIASVIAAVVSGIIASQIQSRNDKSLETLKAELASDNAERDAQRDYRYDAIKRLYTDLQPLLFQLSELCDSSYQHIRGLARDARNGDLGAGQASWLHDEYFLQSTVHRLLLPVALLRLIRLRLTAVDLSVDAGVKAQYGIARALASTWNRGFDLAAVAPPLTYAPHADDAERKAQAEPAVYGLQHLFAGQVDAIADCFIEHDAAGVPQYRQYGAFATALAGDASVRQAIAPAIALFQTFHPRTHPVLWRMLLVQAHLHRAFVATFNADPGVVIAPAEALSAAERSQFDWREPGAAESAQEAVDVPFGAALAYLDQTRITG